MVNQSQPYHVPVLLEEVLQYLDPQRGETYLDATAGYGGHASEVLARTKNSEGAVLVDRDEQAVKVLADKFAGTGVRIVHMHYLDAAKQLVGEGNRFDLILADLGVSSPHLDNADRGFSFSQEGPLDMRMDNRQQLTAEHIVNTYGEAELVDIFRRYGEDPHAKRIAAAIIEHRPISTTTELAHIIAAAVRPPRTGKHKIHPATRVFQALRIAVNDELGQLEQALPLWLELLAPGGRLAIISFHSLEDRIVKQFFAEHGGDRYDAELRILTKSPVSGDSKEIVFNPRARSAKLRAAAKQKP